MKNEKPHFDLRDAEGMTPEQLGDKLFKDKFTVIGSLKQWKARHPAEYEAAKKASGRVDPSRREQNIEEHKKYQPERKTYPEETIRARDKNPPSELDKYYKISTQGYNLHQIKKAAIDGDAEAASRLYEIELSAYSHGYRQNPPTKIEVKKPAEPATFPVSDELCDRYSLPRGTMTTTDEFFEIVATFAKIKAEKKSAEEAERIAALKPEPTLLSDTPPKIRSAE